MKNQHNKKQKKLSLNLMTIANLSQTQLANLKGGAVDTLNPLQQKVDTEDGCCTTEKDCTYCETIFRCTRNLHQNKDNINL